MIVKTDAATFWECTPKKWPRLLIIDT